MSNPSADTVSWRPIKSAPKDGSHILAIAMKPPGFGYFDGEWVPAQTVIHWWGNPGEEGFYTSVNEIAPERPFPATHWAPLPKAPELRPCGCLKYGGDFCKECY